MKTLKSIFLGVCFLFMLPIVAQAQDNESVILNLTEYTVKFGHDANFTDGVKKWIKCYNENEGTNKWRTWKRLQGKGSVYVISSYLNNWAAMEDSDPAGKACRPIALESIIPHIDSGEFNTTRSMPAISKTADLGDNTIVWVTSFKVNNSTMFNNVVKSVTETIKTKEGSKRGYWYSFMGGEGANYFVSSPFKNFADLDKDTDSVWEVYESVHGKSKTKDMRDNFRTSVDDMWSYLYTLESDLSQQ